MIKYEKNYQQLVTSYTNIPFKVHKRNRNLTIIFGTAITSFLVWLIFGMKVTLLSVPISILLFRKVTYNNLNKIKIESKRNLNEALPMFCLSFLALWNVNKNNAKTLVKSLDFLENEYLKEEVIKLADGMINDPINNEVHYNDFAMELDSDLALNFVSYMSNLDQFGYDELTFLDQKNRVLEVYNQANELIIKKAQSKMNNTSILLSALFLCWFMLFLATIFSILPILLGGTNV